MDPFANDPYDSDEVDESSYRWQSEHARALMKDDLEISPLVTAVPPMPGEATHGTGPNIPSSFRGGNSSSFAFKTRKLDPSASVDPPGAAAPGYVLHGPLGSPARPIPPPTVRLPNRSQPPGLSDAKMPPPTAKMGPDDLGFSPSRPGQETLSPQQRPNIRDIVLGASRFTPPTSKPSPKEAPRDALKPAPVSSMPSLDGEADKPASVDSKDNKPAATKKRRRKVGKQAKKVLIANKERDQATALLNDKLDLLDCLPLEACKFLGTHFWIFTVKQLAYVLGLDPGTSELEKRPEFADKAAAMREEITTALVRKGATLLEDDSAEAAGGNEALTNNATEPTGGEENDEASGDGDKAEQRLAAWKAKVEKAGALLEAWKGKVQEYTVQGKTGKPLYERFPLHGPISCLFPESVRNFLASIPIKHLWKFLALKKTETGSICDMMRIWRRECELSELSLLALAKHLLGIATRVEAAITAIPPIDARARVWMSDPMIVLTGAAREFLVDELGILTAYDFVENRTKTLSLKLEAWRARKGLDPLKGSGKVAMISGWKANAKESMEVESKPGRVLHDIDLVALAELENPSSQDEPAPEPEVSKKKPKHADLIQRYTAGSDKRLVYALHSQYLLQQVLGEEITELLKECDIISAASLFDLNFSSSQLLYKGLLRTRRATNHESCHRLVNLWCKKLKDELDSMVSPKRPAETMQSAPAKKARVKAEPKPMSTSSAGAGVRSLVDPYEALSLVTKKFLGSMGIDTAEKFLTTRTTDIANEFVKWRIKEGMPELKGLGAIASVSGWKASIRKAATEMGKDEIAIMEPKDKSSWGPLSRPVSSRRKEKESAPSEVPKDAPELVGHKGALNGKPRRFFAVESLQDPDRQYRFELSVRRARADAPFALFLTYGGVTSGLAPVAAKESPLKHITLHCGETSSLERLEILSKTKLNPKEKAPGGVDPRQPFSSLHSGMGLINIGEHDVRPVQDQDLTLLMEELKSLVLEGKEKTSLRPAAAKARNLIVRQMDPESFQRLILIDTPMERGQALQIIFPDVASHLKSCEHSDAEFNRRHLILEAFQLISREDALRVLAYLEEDLLQAIDYQKSLEAAGAGTEEARSSFVKACESRMRLSWLVMRLSSALGEQMNTEKKVFFSIAAMRKDAAVKALGASVVDDAAAAVVSELKKEVYCALELDSLCGAHTRTTWCPLATLTFDSVLDTICSKYASAGHSIVASDYLEALKAALATVLPLLVEGKAEVLTMRFPLSDDLVIEASEGELGMELERLRRIELEATTSSGEAAQTPSTRKGPTEVVALVKTNGEEPVPGGRLDLRPVTAGRSMDGAINQAWYRNWLWRISTSVIVAFRSLLGPTERLSFVDGAAIRELFDMHASEAHEKPDEGLVCQSIVGKPPSLPAAALASVPHAYPLFLGLVWPSLRTLGWRIEAGETPDDVTFIAPDIKQLPTSRSNNPWKHRRDQRRARLAREVSRTGLGNVQKLAKRLVVSLLPHGEKDDALNAAANAEVKGVSVKTALDRYLQHIDKSLGKETGAGKELAPVVVQTVLDCFDQVAPTMVDDDSAAPALNGKKPSEVYSSDYLMRLLLVLPSILRQSDLPLQAINDSLEIVQDLLDFIATNHTTLFDKQYHPPREHYANGHGSKGGTSRSHTTSRPGLVQRLKILAPAKSEGEDGADEKGEASSEEDKSGVMTEVVLESDKKELTDFVVKVLEQAIPCRASEHDVAKKFRRIHMGYPGFVCRHCQGNAGEGRYFFTTIESLTTASTVFEKHVLKCPAVPLDIKSEVALCRQRHPDQRKQLPTGAQQAFFNRLWDRLRSSKIDGIESGVYAVESYQRDGGSQEDGGDGLEFSDHISLLDFVRSSIPWKTNNAVMEVLNRYYSCLDYGGKINHTPWAGEHFSSEWLLSKVAPRTTSPKKGKMMPG